MGKRRRPLTSLWKSPYIPPSAWAYWLEILVGFPQKRFYSAWPWISLHSITNTLSSFLTSKILIPKNTHLSSLTQIPPRRLDYHPHIHAVIPGGGVDRLRRCWKRVKAKFLFNEFALAKVFRARFLEEIRGIGMTLPESVPGKWVVDCHYVGKGITALKYLSRYLYRGVISEKNIVSNQKGEVTFQYIESDSGETKSRTLKGEDFLRLILLHVLPKGFRRVRDYGLLHNNAKKIRSLVQLILHVITKQLRLRQRPVFICPRCQSSMVIVRFRRDFRGPR